LIIGGTCSDAGMPGAILSCKVADAHGFSIQKSRRNLSSIRDQRAKRQVNKGTAKKLRNKGGPLYLQN